METSPSDKTLEIPEKQASESQPISGQALMFGHLALSGVPREIIQTFF